MSASRRIAHTNTCTRYPGCVNITFALDDAVIAAAKVVAAKQDTTVTAMVRQLLEQHVALDGQLAANAASGVLQVLLDYSMGGLPRAAALQSLGMDDYGALLRLLNAAGLPHPVVRLRSARDGGRDGESPRGARAASMTKARAIRVVIPDTGPLISLAVGEALELLLAVSDDVRINRPAEKIATEWRSRVKRKRR